MHTNHRIGWLGTGRMGTAMAARLLNAGIAVTVWNRTADKTGPLLEFGATQAGSIADLAHCDIVFTTVTSSTDLLAVTIGPGGLLSGEGVPSIIVDCSTVSVESAAEVRETARGLGSELLSAPVSGNPVMVADGAAAIVSSGSRQAFDRARDYLQVIAGTVVYSGTGEEARLVKLCHNLMLGVLTQALAEATTLAEKGGVSPAAFLDFLDGSVLGSIFIRHKGSAIRNRDYEATLTTVNMRKDLDLALAAARTLEVPLPLGAATQQLIQAAIGYGYRDTDYVALYETARHAAGLTSGADS